MSTCVSNDKIDDPEAYLAKPMTKIYATWCNFILDKIVHEASQAPVYDMTRDAEWFNRLLLLKDS